ncbi:MAG: cob(I)yrinic acid a,c-diamide adenosyltransferase [Planctomycetes bacterium]|nr:cob(I)yrinic acid a,c-diamide adenosyltransferase [Planctomycetota bacterium]
MRITRVYTRAGDRGTTRLVGGQELAKNAPRIEAYGTIDELNSVLGLARTFCARSGGPDVVVVRIVDMLRHVQNDLFSVGSDLATLPEDRWEGMPRIAGADVGRLEGWCDELNADLGPLKEFILPGGGAVGAFLHQARTVCRRAERRIVSLVHLEPDVHEDTIRYVNRLSDLLFVLARWAARHLGEEEYLWQRPDAAPRADGADS